MRILSCNFLCHQVLSDSQWVVFGTCTFFLCEICVPTKSERNLVAGGMGKYIHPSLALLYGGEDDDGGFRQKVGLKNCENY